MERKIDSMLSSQFRSGEPMKDRIMGCLVESLESAIPSYLSQAATPFTQRQDGAVTLLLEDPNGKCRRFRVRVFVGQWTDPMCVHRVLNEVRVRMPTLVLHQ